ncbi:MAG: ABC transporter ATP-binding protein [Alphaproteobacteria bacterium]
MSFAPYAFEGKNVQLARLPRFVSKIFNFKIEPGEILAVQASNGGGKSTFLKTLMGGLRPLGGHFLAGATALSLESPWHRRQLAFVGHKSALRLQESVQQQVEEGVALYQSSPSAALFAKAFEQFDLASLLQLPCGVLSQGQRQRLMLCRIHLSGRPCWLLDEPLHHLDAQGIAVFRNSLKSHLEQGGSAVLTSPSVEMFDDGVNLLRL